jgi:[protein-PII] uridylyltransferase
VLQIAVHLGSLEQADALYLLTRASSIDERDRDRVNALHQLVQTALAHTELVGREAANEVERRRSEAQRLAQSITTRERIATAPRAYVLSQTPAEIARQAVLCEPSPGRREVRVSVIEASSATRVEIVARDRVGLIAHATAALLDANCAVVHALATTWDDGTALACYDVSAAVVPKASSLRTAMEDAIDSPLIASPVEGVELTFDDAGSPWHTRCTATAPDRPGLLHTLATAFAAADLSVHSARISTDASHAIDQFDVTDRHGAKLDERAKARVLEVLAAGHRPRAPRFARRKH